MYQSYESLIQFQKKRGAEWTKKEIHGMIKKIGESEEEKTMPWTKTMLGTDVYHIVQWFLIYSILGWIVESAYMSVCNRKLTNRGFVKGPFCPIYGVGALSVYFILRPISHNVPLLYFLGCVFPTLLEYFTARLMLKIFGEVWWDYSEKPFNYKGILCLESTIAWGFYTVFLFLFLHRSVEHMVSSYPVGIGRKLGSMALVLFAADFLHSLYQKKKDSLPSVGEIKDVIRGNL